MGLLPYASSDGECHRSQLPLHPISWSIHPSTGLHQGSGNELQSHSCNSTPAPRPPMGVSVQPTRRCQQIGHPYSLKHSRITAQQNQTAHQPSRPKPGSHPKGRNQPQHNKGIASADATQPERDTNKLVTPASASPGKAAS